MNRQSNPVSRKDVASAAVAVVAAGLLTVAVGCQPKPKADESTMPQKMETPSVNLRSGVPPEAAQVGQESESPTYKADKSGRLYVYDRTANQLVNSFQMREGQELIISGAEGRATLDSNEVAVNQIKPGRTYVLYFLDPTSMGNDSSNGGGDNGSTFRITPANGR